VGSNKFPKMAMEWNAKGHEQKAVAYGRVYG